MKKITKRLYFRLTVLFSIIFLTAFVLFSILTFSFLYQSFEKEDDLFFRRKILSYWASYQNQGEEAFFIKLYRENIISGDRPFMIRVANGRNTTLFLNYPEAWEIYKPESLEELSMQDFSRKVRLRAPNAHEELEVFSTAFHDNLLVQVGMSNGRRIAIIRNYQNNMLLLFIILAVLCVSVGSVLASRALRPIKTLNRTVRDIIATGELRGRVPLRGSGDDLDDLGMQFNTMLERIEILIDRMKDTVNAVAHDLKTPLTRLRGIAELALRPGSSEEEKSEALSDTMEASEEILRMLNSIMDINEAETGTMKLQIEDVSLTEIAKDVIDIYRFVAEEKQIEISMESTGEAPVVKADPSRIRQALGNLIDNGIKYAPEKSQIKVNIQTTCKGPFIAIQDNGPGIPEEEKDLIFNRLYRGSNSGQTKGTGLGLSLVQAIMAAHNGSVEVSSQEKNGSRFMLQFSSNMTCNNS